MINFKGITDHYWVTPRVNEEAIKKKIEDDFIIAVIYLHPNRQECDKTCYIIDARKPPQIVEETPNEL